MHKKPPRNATTLQPNLSLRPVVIGPKRYMTPTLTEPTHAVVENKKTKQKYAKYKMSNSFSREIFGLSVTVYNRFFVCVIG